MARQKKSTNKVTTNTKSVKETKTMGKTMELSAEELKVIQAMRAGKSTEQKTTTKAKTQSKGQAKGASKGDDNFDRDLYESIAEKLNVLGKNGAYRFARPTIYKAMEQEKLTKGDIKKYQDELIELAQDKGLGWYLEKVGVEVETEDEAEEVNVDIDDEALFA